MCLTDGMKYLYMKSSVAFLFLCFNIVYLKFNSSITNKTTILEKKLIVSYCGNIGRIAGNMLTLHLTQ